MMLRKKTLPFVVGLTLTALLAGCGQPSEPIASAPELSASQSNLSKVGDRQYVSNEVVVGYGSEAELQAAVKAIGGTVVDRLPEIQTALVRVEGDALKVAQQMQHQPGLRYALANFATAKANPVTLGGSPIEAQGIPADQIFDELPQYALDPRHLNAKAAWDAGLTGKGVLVAVMDDPGDVTHPDLVANWAGKAYDAYSNETFTDGEAWKKHVASDYASHGTFVASSIVATKNGKGIVGVAPEAKWYPVMINPARKATNEFYSDFAVARGAIWATTQGARVINNSWGGGLGVGATKDAFDYAMEQGVVVVASAGNTYHDQFQFPAGMPGVIASAALDASNRRVTFSTAGRHISTGAPGQDTMLANPTWQGGGFGLISGTSFSGPYTAGVAALVVQKCPEATPYQVRRVMEMNADSSIGTNPQGFDRDTGWGRLDAGKIAANLKDCKALPEKGANVAVEVGFVDLKGTSPGVYADVMLRGKGMRPGDNTDPTPWYITETNAQGVARFAEIQPGTYDVYVAGTDLAVTGGDTEDRGTYLGTLVATSGSTYARPDAKRVLIPATAPDFNPVDPYEPNDTPDTATPIKYGDTTRQAYIFGKPQDADYFKFEAKAGDKITADVFGAGRIGGTLDSYLFLLDTDGKTVLAENDDRGNPRIDQDSEINYTIDKDGTYYLKVSSCTISCDPEHPDDDNNPFNKYVLKLQKSE